MKNYSILFILLLGILGCKKASTEINNNHSLSNFKYLEKVNWEETEDSLIIITHTNRFVIAKKELPLQSAMVIPTSGIAYLNELGLLDKITGISQPDFIFNPE